jgi:plastocyanin
MQIKSFAFSPQTWQAKAGEQIRIIAKNDDTTLHTFTFPAGGVDVAIPPGSERLIEFRAPAADIYQWYCIPHSSDNGGTHTGMVGTLIVK